MTGQAKRRQDAIAEGAPKQYRDMRTGKLAWGRAAPSARAMLRIMQALWDAEDRGERPVAHVPCKGCTACCHLKKIDFEIAGEHPEDLGHLHYDEDPEKPGWALMRHKDGACIHLGPSGCTVYAHRPRCCRIYDCRFYAITGIQERFDNGEEWPHWIAEQRGLEDRIFQAALHTATLMALKRRRQAGEEYPAVEVALEGYNKTPELIPIMQEMVKMMERMPEKVRAQIAAETASGARAFLDSLEDPE